LDSSSHVPHTGLDGDASHPKSKTYGALLALARQGMVVFVPPGAKRDKTRSPGFYKGVSQYLTQLGIPAA
jgi:hypothetical protein